MWPTGCSPRGASRGSPWSRRRRTSAASGRPTRRATASASSPTGPTPPGRSRATATASRSPTPPSPPAPAVHRRRCAERPTLLIADEPHHMGEDATWGRTTVGAFERARFRLLLSGTPFRSDNSPIPWVDYDEDGVSRADYGYGYTDALVDGVCRPVTFHTYGGDMEWCQRRPRRAAPTSASCCRRSRRRGGCAPRWTRTATGSATCCATPTTRCAPARRRRTRTPAAWSSRSTRSTPSSWPTGWPASWASGRRSSPRTPRTRRRGSPASPPARRPGSCPC